MAALHRTSVNGDPKNPESKNWFQRNPISSSFSALAIIAFTAVTVIAVPGLLPAALAGAGVATFFSAALTFVHKNIAKGKTVAAISSKSKEDFNKKTTGKSKTAEPISPKPAEKARKANSKHQTSKWEKLILALRKKFGLPTKKTTEEVSENPASAKKTQAPQEKGSPHPMPLSDSGARSKPPISNSNVLTETSIFSHPFFNPQDPSKRPEPPKLSRNSTWGSDTSSVAAGPVPDIT